MRLVFKPATNDFATILDSGYLKFLWQPLEGQYIRALQDTVGLDFLHSRAVVRCGKMPGSESGKVGREAIRITTYTQYSDNNYAPLRRQADDLLATLTHELGHRLLAEHKIYLSDAIERENYHSHCMLYVFLYDSWVRAFGVERAKQLAVYQASNPMPDYHDSWQWATGLTAAKRQQLTKYLVRHKRLPFTPQAQATSLPH